MTDLFVVLAAVTVICTGSAIPCFFKSSRNTAGFLILTVAVLAATAACFLTPVKDCFASFSVFDIWYYSILFVAAFIISLFYRVLLGVFFILYILWCAFFLILLLPAGYSSSGSIGEVTVSSASDNPVSVRKMTFSPYQMLPFKKVWYKSLQKNVDADLAPRVQEILTRTGLTASSDAVALPESAAYPHVYFISVDDDGAFAIETVF